MNEFIKNTKKSQKSILILSWIALIFSTLISILNFFNDTFHIFYDNPYGMIYSLIRMIFLLPPYILLVLYLTKYYNKRKHPIMIPIIIGLLALYPLIERLARFLFFNEYGFNLLLDLLFIISCILAIISALKGMTKKMYIIISMLIGMLCAIMSFETGISWYGTRYLFYFILEPIGNIGIYMALLLFGIKNTIPAIITSLSGKESSEESSPEYTLSLLKDKLDLGIITEDEYKTQRADIINKL